MEMEQCA